MTEQLSLFGNDSRPRRGEFQLPGDAQPEACRSCGMPIVWGMTTAGKMIPLSLRTVEEREGIKFVLSHFSDCPHAREWSRR